jgi:predicted ATPase/DNA-binding CsgD family transcriptional regulator
MALGASSPSAVSIPISRTRLVGRTAERDAAHAWLLDEAIPLLTLSGPGGVGKTRLAIEIAADVARSFTDGVVWVDLSALTEPALVPNHVAVALGVILTPDRPVPQAITDHLRPRQILLLLDNCEHLLPATAELVAGILANCPAVQILATSRARLRVRGEHVLPVEPLPLPEEEQPGLAVAAASEAVRLFSDRARAAHPSFALTEDNAAAVTALCRRLDGLPLAIELTAARVAALPPEALLSRMSSRLPHLRDGPRDLPPRQQTMRDTIAWSYDLLDAEAQALFRRLAVFVGGFTLDAVAAVWPPDLGRPGESATDALAHFGMLVEHHLVRRDPASGDAEPRYTMLETVREFGLEQMAAYGEVADAGVRHARYFLGLVDTLNAKVAPHLPEAAAVFARLNREHPNLRAALGWFTANGMAEEMVSLAGWLHAFWLHFGYTREGVQWLEQALAMMEEASAAARVWALVGLYAMLWTRRNDDPRVAALSGEAVAVARASGDPLSIGLATEWQGVRELRTGDFASAARLFREGRAAFASLPPEPWIARNLTHIDWALADLAFLSGDFAGAEERFLDVVARQRRLEQEHGAPYSYISMPQTWLGRIAGARGDYPLALDRFQGALGDAAPAGDVRGIINALGGIAGTLAAAGRWEEAARLFGATEAICERTGISFEGVVLTWNSVIGLPAPWQQAKPKVFTATLWAAVRETFPRTLPPISDPAAAKQFWAEGRDMSLEAAIAEASAADLASPPPLLGSLELPAPLPMAKFGLSPREREVLALVCRRLSDAEIGEALSISPRTASSHVAHIYDKLGVGSRREAAALAAHHGLIWRQASHPAEAAP